MSNSGSPGGSICGGLTSRHAATRAFRETSDGRYRWRVDPIEMKVFASLIASRFDAMVG
jgi:hypothetical protein